MEGNRNWAGTPIRKEQEHKEGQTPAPLPKSEALCCVGLFCVTQFGKYVGSRKTTKHARENLFRRKAGCGIYLQIIRT